MYTKVSMANIHPLNIILMNKIIIIDFLPPSKKVSCTRNDPETLRWAVTRLGVVYSFTE